MRPLQIAVASVVLAWAALWLLLRSLPPGPMELKPTRKETVPEAVGTPVEIRPPVAVKPDGPWRREFEAHWRDLGRRFAEDRPWLMRKTIFVFAHDQTPREFLDLDREQILKGLEEVGASRFEVVKEERFPEELKACIQGHILDWSCLKKAVQALRASSPRYSGSILYLRTYATIETERDRDKKPFVLQGVRKSPPIKTIPPGGMASQLHGFAVVSDFMSKYVGSMAGPGGKPYPEETERRWHIKAGKDDDRPAHEIFHLLAMPHHAQIKNPGLPEARICTQCHVSRPSHEKHPHPECTMVCAGNDQPAHRRQHGKSFGLCDTCLTAARALVSGIEGR